MSSKRDGVRAVAWKGQLLVAGGSSGDKALNTVEVYNPQTNKWTNHSSMRVARSYHALVTVGDAVYAIGGSWTDSVECLSDGVWRDAPSMKEERACHAAAVVGVSEECVCSFPKNAFCHLY